MSKGSHRRPTNKAKFDKGFDRIFNKPKKEPQVTKNVTNGNKLGVRNHG